MPEDCPYCGRTSELLTECVKRSEVACEAPFVPKGCLIQAVLSETVHNAIESAYRRHGAAAPTVAAKDMFDTMKMRCRNGSLIDAWHQPYKDDYGNQSVADWGVNRARQKTARIPSHYSLMRLLVTSTFGENLLSIWSHDKREYVLKINHSSSYVCALAKLYTTQTQQPADRNSETQPYRRR